MFAENNKHQTLLKGPSTRLELGVESVMEFVVDLLEGSFFDELAYFLPIVSIHLLLLYYPLFLLLLELSFSWFLLISFVPKSVYFKASFPDIWVKGYLWKIDEFWIIGQICNLNYSFLSLGFFAQLRDKITIFLVILSDSLLLLNSIAFLHRVDVLIFDKYIFCGYLFNKLCFEAVGIDELWKLWDSCTDCSLNF